MNYFISYKENSLDNHYYNEIITEHPILWQIANRKNMYILLFWKEIPSIIDYTDVKKFNDY